MLCIYNLSQSHESFKLGTIATFIYFIIPSKSNVFDTLPAAEDRAVHKIHTIPLRRCMSLLNWQ